MPEVIEEATGPQAEIVEKDTDTGSETDSIKRIYFRLPVFEGPLDLLLHLIKENKIDIYDIPIVEITRQYLEYLEFMKELNLDIAGEYLVMAATLIYIKSRMLLPKDEDKEDETEEDLRTELVRRLVEYKAFKESSGYLRKREEVWKEIFRRMPVDVDDLEFEDEPVIQEASVFDLITAFKRLLERSHVGTIEITRETLTVAERINFIVEFMEGKESIRFDDLFEPGASRMLLVITFVALLEIVRLGLLRVYQEQRFGTLWIINPGPGQLSERLQDVNSQFSESVV